VKVIVKLNKIVLDAIEVAVSDMDKTYGEKKWNKRVFIITDGESKTDETKAYDIIDQLNKRDININFIASDFLDDQKDETSSENSQKTKEVLVQIAEATNKLKIFTAQQAKTIQKQFRKKRVNPVTK
jgi:vacuolar-type H+-ATPase subunit F/Vma7